MKSARTNFVVAILSLAAAPSLLAQAIEEIVVTANHSDRLLSNTEASTSVVGADEINQRQATNLAEALGSLANVNFASGGSNPRFFQIRGIGARSQFVEPLNPSVGLVVDGIEMSGLAAGANLIDTQQIEVLRGPQGTFHGANALAGLVYVAGNRAQQESSFALELGASRFNTREIGLTANTALTEELAVRVAAKKLTSDGYYYNYYTDDDTQNRDEQSLRLAVDYSPTATSEYRFTAYYLDMDNGYDAFNFDNDYATQSDQPGVDQQQTSAASLAATHNGFSSVNVEWNIAAQQSDLLYAYDEDWSYVGFHPWEYSSYDAYARDSDSYNGTLRIRSKDDAPLDWTVGIYTAQRGTDLRREYTYLAAPFSSSFDATTRALFGETTFALNDYSRLLVGARVEQWDADYSDSDGISSAPSETMWGGKLSYEWLLSDDNRFYALVSRGYKAGGFNSSTELPEALRSYETETLWNTELGLIGNGAQLDYRVGIFRQDREAVQIKASRLILRPDGSTQFVDYTDNSAEGISYGIEADTQWRINPSLELLANIGLLHTELDDVSSGLRNRESAHAPSYSASVDLDYQLSASISGRIGLEAKDSFYFSTRHEAQSESYVLLNASLNWSLRNWDIRLWAKNLTDEETQTRGFGSFGNNPANGYITETYVQLGAPRQIGVSAKAEW
ncbi:TonB-dependent receptor [uncultured Umboniibacter sp.]|uniref:TonB-dependent receptor n=1 Tax=uncultured Umboniibacter sp. TaxID=1798917 RepID=UPI002626D6CA|nr:TonB-dependent receptor [uncultured Umboniibacter sp.]